MSSTEKILVSVVVPVYNMRPDYIVEAMGSIAGQTLDKDLMEIIVVDDHSTDQETLDFLTGFICARDHYLGIRLNYIRHEKNQWLAQARRTGAAAAKGQYICFLDSDDMIREDYLKKASLVLAASPGAGWVYPNVKFFGYMEAYREAINFNAWDFFLQNRTATPSLFRKKAWLEVSHREIFVVENVRHYEDWDTIIGLMSKGWFGVPLKDSEYYYRQSVGSMVVRSRTLHDLSKYIVWRANFLNALMLGRAQKNFLKYNLRGVLGCNKWWVRIIKFIERVNAVVFSQMTRGQYNFHYLPLDYGFNAVFFPKRFIQQTLDHSRTMTLAERCCGFKDKPQLTLKVPVNGGRQNKAMLLAHYSMGLLDSNFAHLTFLRAAAGGDLSKITGVISDTKHEESLRGDFEAHLDEHFALDRMSSLPLVAVEICWGLICQNVPQVIIISDHPYFYLLTPFIKRHFPSTKIIDILFENVEAYELSHDYKDFIDKRIVFGSVWKETLIRKYKEKEDKVHVLPMVVDLKVFDPQTSNRNETRASLEAHEQDIVVGFMGQSSGEQGAEVFVKLASLMREHFQYKFVMIGVLPQKELLLKEARELRNFKVLGLVKDHSKYLNAMDVVVSPLDDKGGVRILLEAAAVNVPVIAVENDSVKELIVPGRFGVTYKTRGPLNDALQIKEILLSRMQELRSLGNNGREFVSQHHDLDKCLGKYSESLSL